MSRAASIEPEKVGTERDGGVREKRNKRGLATPNMMAVDAEAVK